MGSIRSLCKLARVLVLSAPTGECVDGKHWSIGNGLFCVFSPLEAAVDLFMKCSGGATRRCTVDVVSLVYVSHDLCALYTVPRISICPPCLIS